MYARALTWWTILRIALEERLVYRGDFALGTLMRFLPIITQIFLWWAIFQSIQQDTGTTQVTIRGYSYNDFVAYYLLTMLGRAFSSMPGLASGISREVRDGDVKRFLVQPIDMIGFLLISRIAHKLAYYFVAILPFALVFYLCGSYFPNWPGAARLGAFSCSLVMGFVLGYFLEACLGLVAFWFLEVSSLMFVYMLFNFFLSGHMFPLDMLPSPFNSIVEWLPFSYLAYFPAAIYLGKIEDSELLVRLVVEAGWVIFFVLLSRWLFARGVRRYSGFGG